MSEAGPALQVRVLDIEPAGGGRWRTTWEVSNRSAVVVEVAESWLPHDQFRAPRQRHTPPLRVEAGGSARLLREVSASVAPGESVENAFLILRAIASGRQWRVFVRLRIQADATGAPRPVVEAVTVERVGLGEA